MRLRFLLVLLAFVTASCTTAVPRHAEPLASAPTLDWTNKWRWVHIDHVDPKRVHVFEGARTRWLAALTRDGGWLPDGRALFWSGTHKAANVYFSFYPFSTWSDLDARTAATKATESKLGKAIVDDYGSGDAALVPPHHSQLWLHLPDMDYVAANASVGELSAPSTLIEYRQMPTAENGDELDRWWPQFVAALREQGFASSCRAYWNLYGGGELVLLWLSADDETATRTRDWLGATRTQAGNAGWRADLERLAPLQDSIVLTRRGDLSHLPAAPAD